MKEQKKTYPEKLIAAFLTEIRPIDIQRAAGIGNTKYYALKRDPDFQQVLTERRTEIIQTAVKRMENNFVKNADTLQAIIDDPEVSPQIRVNALRLYGEQFGQWKMTTDILERIQRIEAGEI